MLGFIQVTLTDSYVDHPKQKTPNNEVHFQWSTKGMITSTT